MKVRFEIARESADVLRCRQLVAEIYNAQYGVVFSEDVYDLEAKIEPWPHRFLMASAGGSLAGACGLYMRNTYVERFGLVTDAEVTAALRDAGVEGRYDPANRREVTKVVVARQFLNGKLYPTLNAFALARAFLDMESERPPLVTCCVTRSVRRLIARQGIRLRRLKPFPVYKMHEAYRSESNPMDSYLVIPELDVPASFRDLAIPAEYDLDPSSGAGA